MAKPKKRLLVVGDRVLVKIEDGEQRTKVGLYLPPTAIGKDYLAGAALVAPSPSGTGGQVSVLGLLGVLAAWEEGLEINLLDLTLGIDVMDPALKVPIVGRLGRP